MTGNPDVARFAEAWEYASLDRILIVCIKVSGVSMEKVCRQIF